MPMMIMSRDFAVNTTLGHRIVFEANTPVWVPNNTLVIQECQRFGAEYAEGETKLEEPVVKLPPIPAGDDRTVKIRDAFQQMLVRNARYDFGANGAPNLKPLEAIVGFTVDKKERDKIWDEYQAELAKTVESN